VGEHSFCVHLLGRDAGYKVKAVQQQIVRPLRISRIMVSYFS
jgi:hypothetical protein